MPRAAVFWAACLCLWVWTPAVAESSCPAIPKRSQGLQQWAKKDADGVFEQLKEDVKVVEAAVGEQSSITIGATGRLKVGESLLVPTLECENLSFVHVQVYRNQDECDGTSSIKTCYTLLLPNPQTPEPLLSAAAALHILDPAHTKMPQLQNGKLCVWSRFCYDDFLCSQ